MKIIQIASGSKGNATLIETDYAKILIDCGISKKRIIEALNKYNTNLEDLDAILLTHEHVDHVSGLVPVYNATNCSIFTTLGTYTGLSSKYKEKIPKSKFRFISNDEYFEIGDVLVETVETFHDALGSIGFVFKIYDKKIVYITDTGHIPEAHYEKLKDADMYIFESNHDPEAVMLSDRPYETKMRIISDYGHMSNMDCAIVLANLITERTKDVVFAHISEECNLVQLVKLTSTRIFKELNVDVTNIKFHYASQAPLEVFEL